MIKYVQPRWIMDFQPAINPALFLGRKRLDSRERWESSLFCPAITQNILGGSLWQKEDAYAFTVSHLARLAPKFFKIKMAARIDKHTDKLIPRTILLLRFYNRSVQISLLAQRNEQLVAGLTFSRSS